MIICRCPQLTLKASPLNSRRSERPADRTTRGASTLKGSPALTDTPPMLMGDPFRVDVPLIPIVRGYCVPSAIER